MLGLPLCGYGKNSHLRDKFVDVSDSPILDWRLKNSLCRKCTGYESIPGIYRAKHPGYVYLAWAEGSPRYKIGCSKDLAERGWSLKTSTNNPYPIRIIHSFYCSNIIAGELHMHRQFEQYRVYREWFELPPEAVVQIMSIQHDISLQAEC
jgi:hypothetical protein